MTIERSHQKGDAASRAIYSPCERYRYVLWRDWGSRGRRVGFVMLNPSTATEVQNDPTVERCERRARTLGFDGFGVANIFAFRATDPRVMRAQADPIGPQNDAAIAELAGQVDMLICAWGTHGAHLGRGAAVGALLRGLARPLHHLGLTQGGAPKHPLYIAYTQTPELWQP
jgi:hypothetical protein